MRFALLASLLLALCAPSAAPADEIALFTVDVKLDGTGVGDIELDVACGPGGALRLHFTIPVDASRTFTVPVPEDRDQECLLTAQPLPGQQLKYLGDGGSVFDPESAGCRFTGVRRGHSNFCQIQVESQETSLTVFKRWIGTSDRQDAVRVYLDCGRGGDYRPLAIRPGNPGTWTLDVNDADGFLCSVAEERADDRIEDTSDCQDLLILPGAAEECTVVNTKVVKMIEMLNRYGLVVMILVFMLVGGFAARRMMP